MTVYAKTMQGGELDLTDMLAAKEQLCFLFPTNSGTGSQRRDDKG